MRTLSDTIIAPITGPPPCAVCILRLSGPDAHRIAKQLSNDASTQIQPRKLGYRHFVTGDDGYVAYFQTANSYTGEESAELSIHGSRASIHALLEAGLKIGARLAQPGEFTERAFMNGRIDLTQAEAVRDTIESRTQAQLRHSNLQREGALHTAVDEIRSLTMKALAIIEAHTDFSEELGDIDEGALLDILDKGAEEIDRLLATRDVGRFIRQGVRIAIIGAPNAGKSSLLNAFVGSDRALVTNTPGTTRDYIEESVEIAGYPFVLIDTAGLRETADDVESLGVQRSLEIGSNADLVWHVTDSNQQIEFPLELARPVIKIANKIDLSPAPPDAIGVSAVTKAGFEDLIRTTLDHAFGSDVVIAIAPRHEPYLAAAAQALATARSTITERLPADLASVMLHTVLDELGKVTGESIEADMLDRIFSDFCIGK